MPSPKSIKIGVLMGGFSREKEISLRSGRAVLKALAEKGFQAEPVEIFSKDFTAALSSRSFDFAFITLHGAGGEDGMVQAVLEKHRIPYLGSGPEASLRAFNKITAKKIFMQAGIPTPGFEVLSSDWPVRLRMIKYPVFVKPSDEGSSIDVFCCESEDELRPVMAPLIEKYGAVLAERKITGRELTVGIIGDKALPVVEIKPKRSFYDYTAKYDSSSGTQYDVPAALPASIADQAQKIALLTHRALGLRDFSRVDMMMAGEELFVLEANTIPGFTETSLLPKAARAAGLSFQDLCSELVTLAWERFQNEKKNQDQKVFTA